MIRHSKTSRAVPELSEAKKPEGSVQVRNVDQLLVMRGSTGPEWRDSSVGDKEYTPAVDRELLRDFGVKKSHRALHV